MDWQWFLKQDVFKLDKWLNQVGTVRAYKCRYPFDLYGAQTFGNLGDFYDPNTDPRGLDVALDYHYSVKHLTPRQQLIMAYSIAGYGPDETAKLMKVTSIIVRYQKHIAIKKLRQLMC